VVSRHLPAGGIDAETRQQLPALLVWSIQQLAPIEPQQVEGDVCDRALLDALGDPARIGEAHPSLKQLEARPSLLVEGDHLAVEDRPAPGEDVPRRRELGIPMGRILPAAAADPHLASIGVSDRPHPVPLQLERPVLAVGRAKRGTGEHRLDLLRHRVGAGSDHGAIIEPMLFELERARLSRAGREVLRDLSARLPEGASCIAGPSGSGKSTVLRLLNRLVDPKAGTVRYRGRDVREYEVLALRREVCLVPQLPALLEGTVEDNVRYAADLAGKEPDVARLLGLAGLDLSYAQRDARRLSVGEQQRTMLARALALEPRVVLLDEPTSALDEGARAAIEGTLQDLRRRLKISLVLVTHDLEQARRMSDWVVRLEDGRAVAEGPVRELIPA
jgi:putative ABC transport system ATP-binding protein